MIALCIESSPKRGMGHFYRALNLINFFNRVREQAVILINQDHVSLRILDEKRISYVVVDYTDIISNWERIIIDKYKIDLWLFDKFETQREQAEHVKNENVILAAIDDCGEGAELVDLHFCSMLFQNLKGRHIYFGKDYLVLNPEIIQYRRQRKEKKKILITMGGSDTYGVTVKIVRILKNQGYGADVIIGPNFLHKDLLQREIDSRFVVYDTVPSLIAQFYEYDLAVTGGGVTCFEANASGLPCIIIANELHEIEIGKYLSRYHGAVFAGYHEDISEESIQIESMNIKEMSAAALKAIPLNGVENIYKVIQNYRREKDAR